MVRLILFLVPSVLSANFAESDVGRVFVALETKPARGIVEGQTYEITQVHTHFHASHSGGGVGINYDHQDLFWNWHHDFNINQQFVEAIAFVSGISLLYIFAKGFTTPFPL